MNFYPANPVLNVPIIWFISLSYKIWVGWGGGGGVLNCAASSLLIAYYKFIPHACLSLGKSLSLFCVLGNAWFVVLFEFCISFFFFFFEGRDEFFISYVHNAS